jgi:hypothetical protein
MIDSMIAWLRSTAVANEMVTQTWLWPICEALHFTGLALLIGTAGFLDLRLLGFMRGVSVAAAMQMRGWAVLGLVINLVTGVAFFVAAPQQYIYNISFLGKVVFLIVAMVNIAVFETKYAAELLSLPADADTPLRAKITGAVSLGSWFAVMYFGRMLAFLGDAF